MTHDANEVRAIIRVMNRFYITGHTNPDGDSIGSCFGLGLALEKMGKEVRVLLEPFHPKYNVIPGTHLIYDGDSHYDDAVLICVDCADLGRIKGVARELVDTLKHTVCIDHHYSNTHFAEYNFVDATASSTCEMVYRVIGTLVELDKDIASALYAGMISDTGGFRHAATSQDTLRAASQLTALGIPFSDIYRELVHLRTYTELKILARVLDTCSRTEDAQVVHACVPQSMMVGLEGTPDATTQDLEGVVEFLLNIRRAKVSLLVYERGNGEVKVSLRSRTINVGAIAQYFGGGGHQLAAGATLKGDVYEVRDKVLPMIQDAINQSNKEKSQESVRT